MLIRTAATIILTLGYCAGGAARAAPLSDAHCADRVDFAIRTAERRAQGQDRQALSEQVHQSQRVFQQQYPDLDEADMQRLVAQVFDGGWTRFQAARHTILGCAAGPDATAPPLATPGPLLEQSMDGVRS